MSCRSLSRPSLSLLFALTALLLSRPSSAYNHTWNRDYFNFPALTDWIPVFNVGDTVNVSWSTDYTERNIDVWCGDKFLLIQTFGGLAPVAYQLIQVLDTWLDPCHFEFYASDPASNQSFNSGAFNVNATKAATPTTWAANDLNKACPTFYTSGNTVPNTTSSAAAAASACTTTTGPTLGPTGKSTLGFGAGIGAGIGISAAVVFLTTLIWWALRRRAKTRQQRTELANNQIQQTSAYDQQLKDCAHGPQYAHYQDHYPPAELHDENTNELPT